ncbi:MULTISPECIES: hypothetical protein [Serratia]|uniref:hypothetical protein n=1 Tax=Serratia TaxID=613 RepID=UPI0009075FC8|nr:hypothetical protein [Serratia marcescens]MBN5333357.1 hypothetical protein [Serratia marcescens]MBN5338001.1 hypothetical protein [Serratia marcescens]MCW7557288.1 hypothetical protein [Serratia marcescens]MCW7562192.1 hypothetical protein [Serratia marcescens]MCW7567204.1 hypothetical protein [Serratia marcescens]
MQPIEHAITKISRNSSRYRGFVITYRPRTIVNPIARYEVSQGDQSYGLFDAQTQATGYIDQLYSQHQAAA